MTNSSFIEILGTVFFACAVLHTFLVKKFEHLAKKYPRGSILGSFYHFLGEVEVVFGIWAGVFLFFYSLIDNFAIYDSKHSLVGGMLYYLEGRNYTEPVFVFVIMCMAATKPIVLLAEKTIIWVAQLLPFPKRLSFYVTTLILGPILGSFITEPAAMTVTAMILLDYYYNEKTSLRFKYATLGVLFVNISIGGTLTNFAAPPVLMVAHKWQWDSLHMLVNFGYKAVIAIIGITSLSAFLFRQELKGDLTHRRKNSAQVSPPWWLTSFHMLFISLVVITAHHPIFFVGIFLFFLGFINVTRMYQGCLKLRESLLVGFFLAGLVTFSDMQRWWLQDLISGLDAMTLFFGSTALTALTDNAALTLLGSLVELSSQEKYSLVAGAVVGGGLTVIANAPNPAGFGLLKSSFGSEGINPLGLFVSAIIPTVIAGGCFQLLP